MNSSSVRLICLIQRDKSLVLCTFFADLFWLISKSLNSKTLNRNPRESICLLWTISKHSKLFVLVRDLLRGIAHKLWALNCASWLQCVISVYFSEDLSIFRTFVFGAHLPEQPKYNRCSLALCSNFDNFPTKHLNFRLHPRAINLNWVAPTAFGRGIPAVFIVHVFRGKVF